MRTVTSVSYGESAFLGSGLGSLAESAFEKWWLQCNGLRTLGCADFFIQQPREAAPRMQRVERASKWTGNRSPAEAEGMPRLIRGNMQG